MSWYFDPKTKNYKVQVGSVTVVVDLNKNDRRSILAVDGLALIGLVIAKDLPVSTVGEPEELEAIVNRSLEEKNVPHEVRPVLTAAATYLSEIRERKIIQESYAQAQYDKAWRSTLH